MNGIASLHQGSNMPQGGPPQGMPQQAPGQAAPGQMPGMPMPQAQGTPMGVTSLIPPLKQLNVQQLQMELMNPGSQLPKFAVLSALDQKIKEQKALQAVMGMQAQQQNAQDPGTVAQQVMQAAQQPVMARHGGAMHSYRQGGIVGYQSGGATSYPVTDPEDETTLPLNERIRRTLARLRMGMPGADERSVNERLREALPEISMPSMRRQPEEGPRQWQQATQGEEPDLMGESLIPPTEPDIGQAPNVAMLGKTGDADIDIGPAQPRVAPPRTAPQAAPQAAPQVKPPAGIAASKPDDLEAAYKSLMNTQGITPAQQKAYDDVLAAEAEMRKAALMGQEKRAQAQLDRARERYENATKGLGGLFGQRGLLALAGSITPERGKVFGSLARGASEFLEREDAVRKEAAGAYELAQAAYDKELSLMDAVRIATAERNTALARGKIDEARAAEQKRAELQVQLVKARQERQYKQRQLDYDRMRAEATQEQARAATTQAGRESETDRRIRLAKEDPATFGKLYGKEKLGLDPYQKAQLMDKASSNVLKDDKQLPVKISNAKAAAAKARRPFDEQAFVDSLINAEYERLIAAGEGRPIKSETPVAGGVARPTTQAAFDALPKGARYINPSDGKEYIKN